MASRPDMELTSYDFLLKMILIGESGTGKSCLLHHFVANRFREGAQHTIGVEFSSRVVSVGGKSVKLQLWDTAGQERFRSVTRSYYRGACACLLVYDITRRSTFVSLERWLSDARALASPNLVVVLVGNKLDREEEREVGYEEASEWAREHGALFLETSSLTGSNVETPFMLASRSILLSIASGSLDPSTPGSGVSYGEGAALRRTNSGGTGISRFSFAESGRGGPRGLKERLGGCC